MPCMVEDFCYEGFVRREHVMISFTKEKKLTKVLILKTIHSPPVVFAPSGWTVGVNAVDLTKKESKL